MGSSYRSPGTIPPYPRGGANPIISQATPDPARDTLAASSARSIATCARERSTIRRRGDGATHHSGRAGRNCPRTLHKAKPGGDENIGVTLRRLSRVVVGAESRAPRKKLSTSLCGSPLDLHSRNHARTFRWVVDTSRRLSARQLCLYRSRMIAPDHGPPSATLM